MGQRQLVPVDAILEHTREGEIIPLRVRIKDEDGQFQAYNIVSYKDMTGRGTFTTADGVYVTNNTVYFECKIKVFGTVRTVRLYYYVNEGLWKMVV